MSEKELQEERKAAKAFSKIGLYLRAGAEETREDIEKSNKKTTEKIFTKNDYLIQSVIANNNNITSTQFGMTIFPKITEDMSVEELSALRAFASQVQVLADKAISKKLEKEDK